jgi:hypothetical protein
MSIHVVKFVSRLTWNTHDDERYADGDNPEYTLEATRFHGANPLSTRRIHEAKVMVRPTKSCRNKSLAIILYCAT